MRTATILLPQPGSLSIVTDGEGHPQALIRTDDGRVVPFGEVDEAHAFAAGEATGRRPIGARRTAATSRSRPRARAVSRPSCP